MILADLVEGFAQTTKPSEDLADHQLAFMVKSLVNGKCQLDTFYQTMTLLFDALNHLQGVGT